MGIVYREQNNIHILELSGKLHIQEPLKELERVVVELIGNNISKLIIYQNDENTQTNSKTLEKLVRLFSHINKVKGSVKLVAVKGSVKQILEISKLYNMYPHYGSLEEAIKSYEEGSE